ncbi:MAG: Protein translocase subunit SecA [Anaerolineales bacterium]|nr:Protein translocase subunit SecA [Anaerolineales bacterium]
MDVGRNDPCPCGSGKKYKHCCWKKNKQAEQARLLEEREERAASASQPDVPKSDLEEPPAPPEPFTPSEPPELPEPPEPEPYIEAFNARWDEFKAQDYEGQIELFKQTLDEEELMNEEMAFAMLNPLYYEAVERDERDRWEGLVAELRKRLPDIYRHDRAYYLDWLITNALAAGRYDEVRSLSREMAETAGDDIDRFNNVVDQLAYHGQLSTLVEMMRIAWPLVQESDNIVAWGVDEFAQKAADFEVFDYLEHNPTPDADDPELMERLEIYFDTDPDRFAHYFAHLTGQSDRHWTMDDFDLERIGAKVSDEIQQNLYDLSVEFLGYLRRQEGVSYTKGELARPRISEYILERQAGELVPRESMLEAAMRRAAGKPEPQHKTRQPDHWLCPDQNTLNLYLGGLFGFINPQYYKLAATFESVPAWLRFLETRGLVDAEQREKTLLELRGLDTELLKVWDEHPADPALREGTEQWREAADITIKKREKHA